MYLCIVWINIYLIYIDYVIIIVCMLIYMIILIYMCWCISYYLYCVFLCGLCVLCLFRASFACYLVQKLFYFFFLWLWLFFFFFFVIAKFYANSQLFFLSLHTWISIYCLFDVFGVSFVMFCVLAFKLVYFFFLMCFVYVYPCTSGYIWYIWYVWYILCFFHPCTSGYVWYILFAFVY